MQDSHHLTIRGEGEGLNWNNGVKLQKVGDFYVYQAKGACNYKLLLDDVQWEQGDNHRIESGKQETIEPRLIFPRVLAVIFSQDLGDNALFIRGTGPGMSWAHGLPLKKLNAHTWFFETNADFEPFEFKVLINDQQWEQGANRSVLKSKTIEVAPYF